jgi:(p)ppGpp synthase/HD superfamily hydrolase
MEPVLEKVRDFADKAHGTQMRKYTPERYIVHPVRVMETCRKYDNSLPVLAAALLHDVLEDTEVKVNELLHFLRSIMNNKEADKTLQLVIEMTDVYVKANYPHFNRRKRKEKELERIELTSPEAQTIKYADIIDNSNEITQQDPDFAPRYLKECRAILKKANKGNPELYEIAVETVTENLQKVM